MLFEKFENEEKKLGPSFEPALRVNSADENRGQKLHEEVTQTLQMLNIRLNDFDIKDVPASLEDAGDAKLLVWQKDGRDTFDIVATDMKAAGYRQATFYECIKYLKAHPEVLEQINEHNRSRNNLKDQDESDLASQTDANILFFESGGFVHPVSGYPFTLVLQSDYHKEGGFVIDWYRNGGGKKEDRYVNKGQKFLAVPLKNG